MKMKRPLRAVLSSANLALIGLPKKFRDVTIEDYIAYDSGLGEVRDYVKNYIDNIDENFENSNGIYFCGANGVGKTILGSFLKNVKENFLNPTPGREEKLVFVEMPP